MSAAHKRLTVARAQKLADDIRDAAERARQAGDGHVSYPYLCGALQVLVPSLVGELAGSSAAAAVEAAFASTDRSGT